MQSVNALNHVLVQLQMLSTTVGAMGLINPMAQITEGGAFLMQDFERVPTLTPPWQHHYRPSLLGSKSTGTEVSSYPSGPVDSTTRVPVLYPHVSHLRGRVRWLLAPDGPNPSVWACGVHSSVGRAAAF